MVSRGERLLVAVSGGPDSVALLAALSGLADEFGVEVLAAHFNHGLRGEEALRDQRCAQEVAARLGIACVVETSTSLRPGANVEARARAQRYAFLLRTADAHGCAKIATGHTLDDQAETVLMRLLRGSGIDGLTGIEPVRDGRIIRPLIDCTRLDVLAFLRTADLPFCEDSSNTDRRFLRNRMRHDVLPLLESIQPAAKRRLARTAEIVADELRFAREHEAQLLTAALRSDGELPVAAVLATPLPLRLVRAWVRQQRGHLRGLSASHFNAILALARGSQPNGIITLPNGERVWREYDCVRFSAEPQAVAPESTILRVPGAVRLASGWRIAAHVEPLTGGWDPPADLFAVLADADLVAGPLVVRTRRPGDRVRALGLGGHRKLQDVLVDRKVPLRVRASCPIIESAGEVLWMPGVVRSSHGLVTASTRSILRLTAQKPAIAGQ